MTVIASLDLATLTNNPASIAEALEDVLEVTSGNLATLKGQAETDANTISNTLLPQAQSAHDTIQALSSQTNATSYHYQSLLNGFTDWNISSQTDQEGGVRVQNLGAIWILNIGTYNNEATGAGNATIVNISNEFTPPSNTVIVGNSIFRGSGENDYITALRIESNGDIVIYWDNNMGTGVHIVGNFMGLDVG